LLGRCCALRGVQATVSAWDGRRGSIPASCWTMCIEISPPVSAGIGRLIDRVFLGSIGWRGIRLRRKNLELLLRKALEATMQEGRRVHIVDIASGPGRYVLETLASMSLAGASATLRDNKASNLAAARQLVTDLGLAGIAVVPGDAFDQAALAAL